MTLLFQRLNIKFDDEGNTILSKEKLTRLLKLAKPGKLFSDQDPLPQECYLLVDSRGTECYPFPVSELKVWQKDGSFEKDDSLYFMKLVKKY